MWDCAVECRKFGRLLEQLSELMATQAEKVVAALRRSGMETWFVG